MGKKSVRKLIEGKVVQFVNRQTKTDAERKLMLRLRGSKVLPFKPKAKEKKPNFADSESIAKLMAQLRDGEAAYLKSINKPIEDGYIEENAPPGPHGEWARRMVTKGMAPGIAFGLAWKRHKAGTEAPVVRHKTFKGDKVGEEINTPPPKGKYQAALKKNRKGYNARTKRQPTGHETLKAALKASLKVTPKK